MKMSKHSFPKVADRTGFFFHSNNDVHFEILKIKCSSALHTKSDVKEEIIIASLTVVLYNIT